MYKTEFLDIKEGGRISLRKVIAIVVSVITLLLIGLWVIYETTSYPDIETNGVASILITEDNGIVTQEFKDYVTIVEFLQLLNRAKPESTGASFDIRRADDEGRIEYQNGTSLTFRLWFFTDTAYLEVDGEYFTFEEREKRQLQVLLSKE
ncbi:hypothetical protein [Aureibacillus halotolerans]|uniref:YhfM-like domain-containing protein n=1 Tax=Aureibacillus halotolerans TaxID=1508390 RepID=A0A4V3D5S6_9BACI|nr:hypothetical protein [Aureibacillus halotolerans]TDQ41177.1 hypothetical protein EV213_104175 [Aureibacillus halotolerans]